MKRVVIRWHTPRMCSSVDLHRVDGRVELHGWIGLIRVILVLIGSYHLVVHSLIGVRRDRLHIASLMWDLICWDRILTT